MSSKNQTTGNLPMHCTDCDAAIIKTPTGTFVCTGCGYSADASPIR
jgi:predicted RNA-binding Zn-ribbon protein involved in translation (DUF1610 family)